MRLAILCCKDLNVTVDTYWFFGLTVIAQCTGSRSETVSVTYQVVTVTDRVIGRYILVRCSHSAVTYDFGTENLFSQK